MRRVGEASLTRVEYGEVSNFHDTLCSGNGGKFRLRLLCICISPCNSEGHSASAFGRGSHLFLVLCAAVSMLTRPLHSLCVAYMRFQEPVNCAGYTIAINFCQEKPAQLGRLENLGLACLLVVSYICNQIIDVCCWEWV
jgi:hypothetical protein